MAVDEDPRALEDLSGNQVSFSKVPPSSEEKSASGQSFEDLVRRERKEDRRYVAHLVEQRLHLL